MHARPEEIMLFCFFNVFLNADVLKLSFAFIS